MRVPMKIAMLALLGAMSVTAAHAQGGNRYNKPVVQTRVQQSGSANAAAIGQAGGRSTAQIRQFGNGNEATIDQTGVSNWGCVMQIGNGLSAGLGQTGGARFGIVQTREGNFEVPADVCMADASASGYWRKVARRIG